MELNIFMNNSPDIGEIVLPKACSTIAECSQNANADIPAAQYDSIFFDLRYFNKPSAELDRVTSRLSEELAHMSQGRVFRTNLRCLAYNLNRLRTKHPGKVLVCPDQTPYWNNLGRAINPHRISMKVAELSKELKTLGYTSFKPGYHFEGEASAYSRVWPTAKLNTLFEECALGYQPLQISKNDDFVFIGLKNEKGEKLPKYPASGIKAKRMNEMLLSYNQFLQKATIHLPSQGNDGKDVWGADFIYRVFNSKELDRGGRFYGGFWMQENEEERAHILINGNKTVELDYKAQHPHMVYALVTGKHYDEVHADKSPYLIHDEIGNPYDIAASKLLLLTAINAGDDERTWRAIKENLRLDARSHALNRRWDKYKKTKELQEFFRTLRGNFETLLQDCFKKHELIQSKICSGIGIELQYLDSQLTEYILKTLMEEDIVCLSVHDSYIVEEQHEQRLREVMVAAYTEINLPKALPPITGGGSGVTVQAPRTLH